MLEQVHGEQSTNSGQQTKYLLFDKLSQNSESCHCQFSLCFKNPNAKEMVKCLRVILKGGSR